MTLIGNFLAHLPFALLAYEDGVLEDVGVSAIGLHPFWRFDWGYAHHAEAFWCSAVLMLSGILCSAAGIGGGGIYVAVLMVVGGLSPGDAVPLSKAVVFFGAAITFVMNLRRMFTEGGSNAGLIDWNICRLMVPPALMGTLLGVGLNSSAADWIIVSLLSAILVFMTVMVCQKGYSQYQHEQEEADAAAYKQEQRSSDSHGGSSGSLEAGSATEEQALLGPPGGSTSKRSQFLPSAATPRSMECRDLKEDSKGLTMNSWDVFLATSMLCVVIFCGVIRHLSALCMQEHLTAMVPHSASFDRGFGCNDPILKMIFASQARALAEISRNITLVVPVLGCLCTSVFYGHRCVHKSAWPIKGVLLFQGIGLMAGMLAGLVGIGGGLIFSPFFLMIGVDPAVAVATSSTCVIFTSSSTTIQYLLTNRIIVVLALVYGFANLFASFLGTRLVHSLQDLARPSIITLFVAVGVGLSAVLSLLKLAHLANGEGTPAGH